MSAKKWIFSLSGMIWWMAFGSLAMAAILSPPTTSGVVGVSILGWLLTSLAVGVDVMDRRPVRRPDDATFLTSVLFSFACVEAFGLVVAKTEGEAQQAVWFASAMGFAMTGMLASWRGGASDGDVAAQLFFHGVLIVPAIAPIGKVIVTTFGSREAISAFGVAGPVARLLLVIGGIAMAPLFAGLVFVVGYDLARRDERRAPIWLALMIHQAAYVFIALRWSYDGL